MISGFESNRELPGTYIDVFEIWASNKWGELSKRTAVHRLLEGRYYHPLGKLLSFLVVYIGRGTEFEKRAPMPRVYLRCSEIVSDVVNDKR